VGDWNVPAAQGVHATLPGSVLNKPSAHGAHATPEWFAEKPARHSHCSRPRVMLRGFVYIYIDIYMYIYIYILLRFFIAKI